MVKNKLLIIFPAILIILMYSNYALASAWLPMPNKYKYIFSIGTTSKLTRKSIAERAQTSIKIRRLIYSLYKRRKSLPENSAQYLKLTDQIKILEQELNKISSYSEKIFTKAFMEYAPAEQISFGLEMLFQDNHFIKSSFTKNLDLFLKVRYFEKENYIFSIQPKISFKRHRNFTTEYFQELAFLIGSTYKWHKIEIFTDNNFTFGGSIIPASNNTKSFYSLAFSQGLKFPSDIMLIFFSQLNIRKNYNPIYSRTIFNQFSVAKTFKFGNLHENNISIQLGYFINKSLINPNYQVSGIQFSLWLNI